MKKILCVALLFFILNLHAHCQKFPQKENTSRIMTYNIHHGEGMDGTIDIPRIGQIILDVNPEIIGLQEVDSVIARSNNLDILQLLAKQTNMHAIFGHSIVYEGGKYGNGILSKQKPISSFKIFLPGAEETRSALVAEFAEYVVVNTHLSLDDKEREESIEIITKAISYYEKPVFLLGDLNDIPGSKTIKLLENNWQMFNDGDQHTFPSVRPDSTLDYVWGYCKNKDEFAIHKKQVVVNEIASDHRPLFVDVRLKTDASKVMRTIPYLQNPDATEMTVMWLTNVPCRSWVEFGTDPNNMVRVRDFMEGEMVANNKINRIKLSDLKPNTKYYYRAVSQEILRYSSYKKVFGDTVRSEIKSFTTWGDKNTDFRILVYNDIHHNMSLFEKLQAHASVKPYDLVIFNGDCIDDAEEESDIVNRLLTYTKAYKSDETPAIFVRGNHELRGEYSQHLWSYLGKIKGRSYGAFTLGYTRFVILDCGEDKPDDHWVYYDMNDFTNHRIEQGKFLKNEINSQQFKSANRHILIHHIPLFGKNLDSYTPCSELWKPILKNAPFDLSLHGHTHTFEVIEKGKEANNFPVIIGGGYKDEAGTVMILEKQKNKLSIDVLNIKGESIYKKDFK